MSDEEYTYVEIPIDGAMVERRHKKNTSLDDDDLRETLKKSMTGLSGAALEKYVETHGAALRGVGAMPSIETIALTIPSREKPWAVSLYADEKANEKGLRANERASAIARACGLESVIHGDAFLSRYFDDDDRWVRTDFRIQDCSSDAEWIRDIPPKRKKKWGIDLDNPVRIDAQSLAAADISKTRRDGAVDWTQTPSDLELRVPVTSVPKSEIRVVARRTSLSIHPKILDIPKLFAAIETDTCWTLEDDTLVLTLDKAANQLWTALRAP